MYDDVSDSEVLNWGVDSVSAVPKDCKQVESVYSAEVDELGKVGVRSFNVSAWVYDSFNCRRCLLD